MLNCSCKTYEILTIFSLDSKTPIIFLNCKKFLRTWIYQRRFTRFLFTFHNRRLEHVEVWKLTIHRQRKLLVLTFLIVMTVKQISNTSFQFTLYPIKSFYVAAHEKFKIAACVCPSVNYANIFEAYHRFVISCRDLNYEFFWQPIKIIGCKVQSSKKRDSLN